MTDVPDPSKPPPQQPPPQSAVRPEPPCALAVMCIECGDGAELPLPIDRRALTFLLAQGGWFTVVLSAPQSQDPQGQMPQPMTLGPLCPPCAQKVYAPDVFAAIEHQRQQLLQAAAQAAAAARAAQESR